MLKIITLACALFGILCAVSIESWLRRRTGNKEIASEVYSSTIEKYSEFWISQIIPIFTILIITGLFIGFGIGLKPVIAYAAGAFTVFLSVYIGSRSFTSSVVSSASIISDGNIRVGLKSAFRGGTVIGLVVSSFGIIALSILFFMFKQKQLVNVAASFALGASIVGVGIRLSGSILTSAHKLSDTKGYNKDYVGSYASNGAEFILLILISASAAALLAEIGVDTSGVTSVFNISSAAKYPIIVLACGVAASAIGAFTYRPGTGKNAHLGITVGNIIAGLLSFGAALYFSETILDSRAYAYCVGIGILAILLTGEFCKIFSLDSNIYKNNIPKITDDDIDIPMIHGLSVGMLSLLLPGIIIISALIISYNIANYYGIALTAIGANSISGICLVVRNYATSLSAASSFAISSDELAEENKTYYSILNRTSAKAKASGKAYMAVSEVFTLTAVLSAFNFKSGNTDVLFSYPPVFGGMVFGAIFVFVVLGALIRAIITSTNAMLESSIEDPEEYRNVTSLKGPVIIQALAISAPLVMGFVLGTKCLTGFIGVSIITETILAMTFNNTGRYYDRISTDALGSIIIAATAVALAALPAFTQFGAVFF